MLVRPRRGAVLAACAVALFVVVVGLAVRPTPPQELSTEESGDSDLLDRVRPLLEQEMRDTASVVNLVGDSTLMAHYGADDTTDYEIGSIAKAMVGLLLADAVERGEVAEDTELGELLDLGDTPAAAVTLAELSSHHSGLPRFSERFTDVTGNSVAALLNRDPYPADAETLVEQLADAELEGRGEFTYSNLGVAALGQALAEATGDDYGTLLQERILDPLGMADTTLPVTADNVPDDATVGYAENGHVADPWTMNAYAPAGGVRSTPADMAVFAQALLDGSAPGADEAMEPRWDDDGDGSTGLGWVITEHDGTEVTWHNGITGGFASMLALDREEDEAVVVLNNTAPPVDEVGLELLLEEEG